MATVGQGTQGGYSIIAPSYKKYITKLTFDLVAGVPQTFPRVCGPHRIVMSFTPLVGSTTSWSFAITGGSNQVATEVLPMFPRNPEDLYNKTINYRINGSDLPPFGCSITTLPVPPASAMTTRVNIFQVDEIVTGSGLSMMFAYCPFAGIDPTITSTTSVVVDMRIISYRAEGDNHRAIGYQESRGAPFYIVRNFPTIFTSVAGVNPLDSYTPLQFQRISGMQTILVADTTTGFYFSFDVDYGIIGQAHGFLGYNYNPTPNASLASKDIENATLVGISSPTNVHAQEKVEEFILAASDGRAYKFAFDPSGYNQLPPTIQLLAPSAPLGADNLVVNVFVRYFQTL